MKITFEESAKEFVLDAFGKTTNSEGFIIDKKTLELEKNRSGKAVHINNFAGYHADLGILENDLETMLSLNDLQLT